jgi:DNA-nicking Smr family endonuclease
MNIPTLDLHGLRHHEVSNEVARFIETWLGKGLFIDIITGNSENMILEATKVIQQYGLEYYTGLPTYL